MSNYNTSEGTQVRKTISFSKKRDKDLIALDEFEDDFSYNAKQLIRDGLRFRQLMKGQNVSLNPLETVDSMQNSLNIEGIKEVEIVEKEPKKEQELAQKPTNMSDFLNSKTKNSEISEEDRKRIENNLDF